MIRYQMVYLVIYVHSKADKRARLI